MKGGGAGGGGAGINVSYTGGSSEDLVSSCFSVTSSAVLDTTVSSLVDTYVHNNYHNLDILLYVIPYSV